MPATSKPCEYCGKTVTKTATQQTQRKYWTCNASCANKRRIQLGHSPGWAPNPYRGLRETRPCAICSTPTTRYLSERVKGLTWTCSRSCGGVLRSRFRMAAGVWKRPINPKRGEYRNCEICGSLFYRNQGELQKGPRFCSKACHDTSQRTGSIVQVCEVCGKTRLLSPSKTRVRTCSKVCWDFLRIKRPLDRLHNGKPAHLDQDGYVLLWTPDHPATRKGWMPEHRLVVEQRLGRFLRSDEHVDHINRIKDDNRSVNLQVLSQSEHGRKTGADTRRQSIELIEYRRRYGPLV